MAAASHLPTEKCSRCRVLELKIVHLEAALSNAHRNVIHEKVVNDTLAQKVFRLETRMAGGLTGAGHRGRDLPDNWEVRAVQSLDEADPVKSEPDSEASSVSHLNSSSLGSPTSPGAHESTEEDLEESFEVVSAEEEIELSDSEMVEIEAEEYDCLESKPEEDVDKLKGPADWKITRDDSAGEDYARGSSPLELQPEETICHNDLNANLELNLLRVEGHHQPREKNGRVVKRKRIYNPHAKHAVNCQVCGSRFPNRAALEAHGRTTGHNKRFCCPHCEWAFAQKVQLERHMEAKHSDGQPVYSCKLCGREFRNEFSWKRHESNLDLHRRMARPIQECYVCGRKLARRNSWAMKQHIRTHTKEERQQASQLLAQKPNCDLEKT